jgi:caprin-1
MVVRPSSGASNVLPVVTNAPIDFDILLNEPFKYIEEYIKKKVRNLEKRKGKLDGYNAKLKKGEALTKDQQEAG